MNSVRPMFPHVVDSTMLNALRECPQKMFRTYMQHWKSRYESIHLHAGASLAKGLEETRKAFYYDGLSSEESEAIGMFAMMRAYGLDDPQIETTKTIDRLMMGFTYFFDQWPLGMDGFEPLDLGHKKGIEFSFLEPLGINHPITGDPIMFSGRADMLGTFCSGIMLEDDKTTSALGATWPIKWEMRGQFTGYTWAAREALGIDVKGVLVRGLCILKNGFNHMQVPTYRSRYEIELWYNQTIRDINRLINMWTEGYYDYNLGESCAAYGGCSFQSICKSENPDDWLPATMVQRVWDPVSREEITIEDWEKKWQS